MGAWRKDNYQKLLSKWGTITQYSSMFDEGGFYQVPRIQVKTSSTSKVQENVMVLIEGKEWQIIIEECGSYDYKENE